MMKRTWIGLLLTVATGLLIYHFGLRYIFGYRIDFERVRKVQGENAVPVQAAGVAEMFDTGSRRSIARIDITAYNQIYSAIGVGRDQFSAWLSAHGPSGTGEHGELLAAAFPIFSKVAWMFVEPVDLTADETGSLIDECERAATRTSDSAAIRELGAIRRLAADALDRSAAIRFGHR
jgi:hypothetical protein